VLAVSSEKREKIHLSAVIVNNFVNYLYQVANDLMQEQSLSFDLLKPLIMETANKINNLSPAEAQTGPAKRNDKKTILFFFSKCIVIDFKMTVVNVTVFCIVCIEASFFHCKDIDSRLKH